MASLVKNSLDQQLSLEAEFSPVVSDLLAAAMQMLVEALRQGQPSPLLPQAEKAKLRSGLRAIWSKSAENSVRLILDEFSAGFRSMDAKSVSAANTENIIADYVGNFGAQAAAQIISTTEKQVNDLILGGLRQGEARDAVIRQLLEKIPAIAEGRAKLITTTEVHGAMQFASQKIAERSSWVLSKTWNSVNDDKTRDFGISGRVSEFNHRVMNGVTVGLSQSFFVPMLNGGLEPLYFVGDPRGSAGNVINCRCVQSYERLA